MRCASWARATGVDPVGSAGTYRGYCCIEWPRPWPRDLRDLPALAPLAAELARRDMRLQALIPASPPGRAKVMVFRPGLATGFTVYQAAEAECSPRAVVATALELLDGAAGPTSDTHVLVCTHGRRDACCGSRGTSLMAAANELRFGSSARLWATSHLGGHRFAPTAIVLPAGTAWAFLDPDVLQRIVRRTGPVEGVLAHYRGCTGLGSPALQALERRLLLELGWDLFDCRRTGTELGEGRVRLDVTSPDGVSRCWEGLVECRRSLTIPPCGRPLDEAPESEAELSVKQVHSVI
jgi:hypothetical protein